MCWMTGAAPKWGDYSEQRVRYAALRGKAVLPRHIHNPLLRHMSCPYSITVRGALNSAGAEVVRSMQLPSGITLSEWTGRNTLTEYKSSAENVLSIYLSGGEIVHRSTEGRSFAGDSKVQSVCFRLMKANRSGKSPSASIFCISTSTCATSASLLRALRQPPEAYRFREVFQEASRSSVRRRTALRSPTGTTRRCRSVSIA